MKYLSLFSGIGGLESIRPPMMCCEIDKACQHVLRSRFNGIPIVEDVRELKGVATDIVCGGWPCQDLSVAGLQTGLKGKNSRLFFELLRVAEEAGAHTIVAENVPNLLVMENGKVFMTVLSEFQRIGYEQVAWRTLNARSFGLPHQRQRVFIVASTKRNLADTLHRELPGISTETTENKPQISGFYWTAGTRSICYSRGFIPTLKVGSSVSIPSPPAIHYDNLVRMLLPHEALALQGFLPPKSTKLAHFDGLNSSDIYRMAGNAVAAPVGRFVVEGVLDSSVPSDVSARASGVQTDLFGQTGRATDMAIPKNGISIKGDLQKVETRNDGPLATNLSDFIFGNSEARLSSKAARGLLSRLERSGLGCPSDLHTALKPSSSWTPCASSSRSSGDGQA